MTSLPSSAKIPLLATRLICAPVLHVMVIGCASFLERIFLLASSSTRGWLKSNWNTFEICGHLCLHVSNNLIFLYRTIERVSKQDWIAGIRHNFLVREEVNPWSNMLFVTNELAKKAEINFCRHETQHGLSQAGAWWVEIRGIYIIKSFARDSHLGPRANPAVQGSLYCYFSCSDNFHLTIG